MRALTQGLNEGDTAMQAEAHYLRCEVLFPGAAVASTACISVPVPVGGESTKAGKHEALS